MTNQTSEDELREELRKVIWYELGDGLNGTDVDECAVTLLNIIRTEKLKLLAEVRERAIPSPTTPAGENEFVPLESITKLEAEL